MSRFNSTAYDKLFPRVNDPDPAPESSVDTFRPSQEKKEDPAAEKSVPDVTEVPVNYLNGTPADPEIDGGDVNGDGGPSEPDLK